MIHTFSHTAEVDVTPRNWNDAPYLHYEDKALVVHAWVAEQTRPMREAPAPKGFHVGELQAVTVSVTAPHVVFRMMVCDGVGTNEVKAFREKATGEIGLAIGIQNGKRYTEHMKEREKIRAAATAAERASVAVPEHKSDIAIAIENAPRPPGWKSAAESEREIVEHHRKALAEEKGSAT